MDKKIRYKKLINKRQKHCFPKGLINYRKIDKYKNEFVDFWEKWHGHLDAKIMLIGQDYSDRKQYEKECKKGGDKAFESNLTNQHLVELFEVLKKNKVIMRSISTQSRNQKSGLFFTNAVIGLKDGGMQAKVKKEWWINGAENFLKDLIEIVQPEIIITLGKVPLRAVCHVHKDKLAIKISSPLKELMKKSPYYINTDFSRKIQLFPVYHCGGRALTMRNFETQKNDWEKIKKNFL